MTGPGNKISRFYFHFASPIILIHWYAPTFCAYPSLTLSIFIFLLLDMYVWMYVYFLQTNHQHCKHSASHFHCSNRYVYLLCIRIRSPIVIIVAKSAWIVNSVKMDQRSPMGKQLVFKMQKKNPRSFGNARAKWSERKMWFAIFLLHFFSLFMRIILNLCIN